MAHQNRTPPPPRPPDLPSFPQLAFEEGWRMAWLNFASEVERLRRELAAAQERDG